jgi:hypothetical protein
LLGTFVAELLKNLYNKALSSSSYCKLLKNCLQTLMKSLTLLLAIFSLEELQQPYEITILSLQAFGDLQPS